MWIGGPFLRTRAPKNGFGGPWGVDAGLDSAAAGLPLGDDVDGPVPFPFPFPLC